MVPTPYALTHDLYEQLQVAGAIRAGGGGGGGRTAMAPGLNEVE